MEAGRVAANFNGKLLNIHQRMLHLYEEASF